MDGLRQFVDLFLTTDADTLAVGLHNLAGIEVHLLGLEVQVAAEVVVDALHLGSPLGVAGVRLALVHEDALDDTLFLGFAGQGDQPLVGIVVVGLEHALHPAGGLGLDIAGYLILHEANRKIEDEYRKSDVFCLPSLYEGYPNVVAEAMSCELPIICSNVYENPYIVEDGVNGFLFDPENVDDMVRAIQKVASISKEERRKMGVLNRQLCLKRNTEEEFLKSYIKLIESL